MVGGSQTTRPERPVAASSRAQAKVKRTLIHIAVLFVNKNNSHLVHYQGQLQRTSLHPSFGWRTCMCSFQDFIMSDPSDPQTKVDTRDKQGSQKTVLHQRHGFKDVPYATNNTDCFINCNRSLLFPAWCPFKTTQI